MKGWKIGVAAAIFAVAAVAAGQFSTASAGVGTDEVAAIEQLLVGYAAAVAGSDIDAMARSVDTPDEVHAMQEHEEKLAA